MSRRLCLVTGASAGIGAAFARVYASHGYDVFLTARRQERLDTLAAELRLHYGVEAFTVAADLSKPGAVDAVLSAVAAEGRDVDVLINNAGYGLPGSYAATTWPVTSTLSRVSRPANTTTTGRSVTITGASVTLPRTALSGNTGASALSGCSTRLTRLKGFRAFFNRYAFALALFSFARPYIS